MTPKEKAKQLVDRFSTVGLQQRNEGIACAEIAVDEIIENTKIEKRENVFSGNTKSGYEDIIVTEYNPYWQQVKKEIEAL